MHPKDFPPGPRLPLPFIGDGYVIGNDIIPGLQKMKKKYGPTCGFWLGNERCVLLTDFDLIQEAMNKPETSARHQVAAASGWSIFFHLLIFSEMSIKFWSSHFFHDFSKQRLL